MRSLRPLALFGSLVLASLACLALPGCIYDELLATHVEPGGSVKATMNMGPEMDSTAMGEATKEPLTINGFSPNLTFGLIAGADTAGATALADLAKPNVAVQLLITPTSVTRLEIHLGGTGCVAQTGTIDLRTDNNKNFSGDFQADGTVSGSAAPCQLAGTLDAIPVER